MSESLCDLCPHTACVVRDVRREQPCPVFTPTLAVSALRAALQAAERERDEAQAAAGRSEYGRKMMRLHLRDSLSRARRLLARDRARLAEAMAKGRTLGEHYVALRAEAARLRAALTEIRDDIESGVPGGEAQVYALARAALAGEGDGGR